MQYDFLPNSPQVYSSANCTKHSRLPLFLGIAGAVLLVFFAIGVFAIKRTSPSTSTVTADVAPVVVQAQTKLPAQAPPKGVAGATSQAANAADSSFTTLTNAAAECTPSTVFSIGVPEIKKEDNPADELNWSGTLEVLPEYPDPFVVNVNSEDEFPWRTTAGSAQPVAIQFSLNQGSPEAQLLVGWSPGKSSQKALKVLLDDVPVSQASVRNGDWADGNWEQLPLTTDSFSFPVSSGSHTITLMPDLAGGDPVVWDFITLNTVCQ